MGFGTLAAFTSCSRAPLAIYSCDRLHGLITMMWRRVSPAHRVRQDKSAPARPASSDAHSASREHIRAVLGLCGVLSARLVRTRQDMDRQDARSAPAEPRMKSGKRPTSRAPVIQATIRLKPAQPCVRCALQDLPASGMRPLFPSPYL